MCEHKSCISKELWKESRQRGPEKSPEKSDALAETLMKDGFLDKSKEERERLLVGEREGKKGNRGGGSK